MFKALASFWVMVSSFISGFTKFAEAFDEIATISKEGATNLRKEMQLEAIAARKELIKTHDLNEDEVKEATAITEIKAVA